MGQADPRGGTASRLKLPNPEREQFSREAAAANLKPLWERRTAPGPGGPAAAAFWRYADVRRHLMRAAVLITARDAERRVLVLENPALPGTTFIGATLFAGMQLILPGEIAPVHRHSPNALRFIVEGEGAYTTLDGERIAMHPGDFVVTRGWTWHDHGNLGTEPVIWMDGLDTPLAQLFGAHFREDYDLDSQALTTPATAPGQRRRLYPYRRMQEQLQALARRAPPHACHGHKLRYRDPADGADPIPTVAAFLQSLPAGFAGMPYRSTECAVYNVAQGQGVVTIGGTAYEFAPHDVFVVPAWTPYGFSAQSDCLLFSYTDRAAQEMLGFWREQG
jgi:gentisate 1,2-dioxygenase